jgi:molecular chaperone DnaJ
MAALNEAWRVLSDPGRRALYDLSLRDPVDAPRAVPEPAVWLEPHAPATARRFPVWPFVALFVLAVIFIMTAGGLSDDPQPLGPDNVITAGSCVSLEPSGDAVEVACDGLHDAVAVALVGFDQTCPSGSAAHRDRQGRGWVCVEPG